MKKINLYEAKSVKDVAKEYGMASSTELFDYIEESIINGQQKQAKEIYGKLDVAGKKEFARYVNSNELTNSRELFGDLLVESEKPENADEANKVKLKKFMATANKESESITFMTEGDRNSEFEMWNKKLGDGMVKKTGKTTIKFNQSAAFKTAMNSYGPVDANEVSEASNVDITHALKAIADFNKGVGDKDTNSLANTILKHLGYKSPDETMISKVIDHLGASSGDDGKIIEDKDVVKEIYSLFESNEAVTDTTLDKFVGKNIEFEHDGNTLDGVIEGVDIKDGQNEFIIKLSIDSINKADTTYVNLGKADIPKIKAIDGTKPDDKLFEVSEGTSVRDKDLTDQMLLFIKSNDPVSPEAIDGQFPNHSASEIASVLAKFEKEKQVKVKGDSIIYIGEASECSDMSDEEPLPTFEAFIENRYKK